MLLVMGTITDKMVPVLKKIYDQMPDPKWVVSMGACATSGGFYRAYHVVQGIDEFLPVDVYIPGCPPTPEAVLQAVLMIQEVVKGGPSGVAPRTLIGKATHEPKNNYSFAAHFVEVEVVSDRLVRAAAV